jgi:hypothetical protein
MRISANSSTSSVKLPISKGEEMIQVGSRVKIKPNYSGGLEGVLGKTAKVTKIEKTAPEICSRYVLDIKGERTHTYNYGGNPTKYTRSYYVIVDSDEVEEVPYEFKDCEGNIVEIGDLVVYGSYGGGLTKGTVVDFKDTTYPRWGNPREELKMKVEYDCPCYESDGNGRRISFTEKRTQWFSNGGQTLIVQKCQLKNVFQVRGLEVLRNDG